MELRKEEIEKKSHIFNFLGRKIDRHMQTYSKDGSYNFLNGSCKNNSKLLKKNKNRIIREEIKINLHHNYIPEMNMNYTDLKLVVVPTTPHNTSQYLINNFSHNILNKIELFQNIHLNLFELSENSEEAFAETSATTFASAFYYDYMKEICVTGGTMKGSCNILPILDVCDYLDARIAGLDEQDENLDKFSTECTVSNDEYEEFQVLYGNANSTEESQHKLEENYFRE